MLISQFCSVTGLTRDTVRFYVRRGLLKPSVGRGGSNRYQSFDAESVDRAFLIREAQALGWSLREIAAFADEYERGDLTEARKIQLMVERLQILDAQAQRLRQVRKYMQRKIEWMQAGGVGQAPVFAPAGATAVVGAVCANAGHSAAASALAGRSRRQDPN